ncbi:NAD-dependent succinate-semialdehyde dehydrogenase [Corynebacterium breve]|uniref:NAD-dependent succinate-semialdehyde dehydrogenase n=1 Tax=Corynebacterium breve TaxID=3049799 RepID=A0ABY8VIN8_9CORY|nr:NAD-dependent succinate-semialdehyde dehydrogenase [Corynebacterium breve]WIM68483.1 NAD-dependent succinate-semialdehyde dehydrogenase [Corynebacterium breve]
MDISSVVEKVHTQLLISDRWRDGSDGETYQVENPATGEVLATMSSASESDALDAMNAACDVQKEWSRTSPRERSDILRRAFELVTERKEEFATLMTAEMGKPYAEAVGEVAYGAEYLRWFSEEAVRQYGRTFEAPEGGKRLLTVRKPVGPCLLITPWNFPLAMATRKVAPAVAAGCTMVLKPAKLTPLTAHYFAQTMLDAGLPAGVLNVVSSQSASTVSEPIMADPRLRKVSFTGSTEVGRTLLKGAADNILRTSMELGGNAPVLVFEDADLDVAVEGTMQAKMRNIGEACTAANRIFVHESLIDEFSHRLTQRMEELKVGNGFDDDVTVGPLIEEKAVDNVASLIDNAVDHGAKVTTGGTRVEGPGYFFAPTVLTGATPNARVFREEIFGPVAVLYPFSTEEEAYSLANDTEFGLASYVFSENPATMFRASDNLEFGLLGFNTGIASNAAAPFGGVKHSGMGREGGAEGIDEYSEIQYIAVADPY